MELFDKLLELHNDIDYIYRKLYNIESNGYKSSNLFSKTTSALKDKLIQEERVFDLFVKSDEYEQIKDRVDIYDGKEDFFLRMRDRIILYEIMDYKEEIDDDEEILAMKEMTKNIGKIYDFSSKNLFLLYAYFLDNTIEKLVIKSLKKQLISIKYYNCLIKHNFEKALLDYDFAFPSEVYSDLNLMLDLMKLDEEFTRGVVLDSYMTSINNSLENLMFNSDDVYSNNEGMLAVSINYQCLLKAAFALMSEYEYCMLENQIIEKIRELGNVDNFGMIENVVDIINNRNEYRSKVRKISLRPLK